MPLLAVHALLASVADPCAAVQGEEYRKKRWRQVRRRGVLATFFPDVTDGKVRGVLLDQACDVIRHVSDTRETYYREWTGVRASVPCIVHDEVRRSAEGCFEALAPLFNGLPSGAGDADVVGGHKGSHWDFSLYISTGEFAGLHADCDAFTCDAPVVQKGMAQRTHKWAEGAFAWKVRAAAVNVFKEGLRGGAPLIILALVQLPTHVAAGFRRRACLRVHVYRRAALYNW
eukprot:gene18598-18895_t